MNVAASSLARASIHAITTADLARSIPIDAPAPVAASAELLRLGASLPDQPRPREANVAPPSLSALDAVARIGLHLGRLERTIPALPREAAQRLDRALSDLRSVVDCASALSSLRRASLEAASLAQATRPA